MVQYRDVPNYEGLYRVGDDGSVWSSYDFSKRTWFGAWRQLRPIISDYGYPVVSLTKNKKARSFLVGWLVLEAFIGPRPTGLEMCHKNRDRQDNRPSNLRWDTSKANAADRVAHGTSNKGETHGMSKLTNAKVVKAKRWREKGWTQSRIAKRLGVSQSRISAVLAGKSWAHVQ